MSSALTGGVLCTTLLLQDLLAGVPDFLSGDELQSKRQTN